MVLFLASVLLLQATPSEAEKLEASLKRFGDRNYRVLRDGKEAGTLTLKQKIEVVENVKVVSFEDRLSLKVRDGEEIVNWTEESSLEDLRLRRTVRSPGDPDDDKADTMSIRGDDAYVLVKGRQLLFRDAKGAVGERTLLRLVCLQDQKVGSSFKAVVAGPDVLALQEGRKLSCVAKEKITIGGREIEAFKWEDRWTGKDLDDAEIKISNNYWVSADGVLLRLKSGDFEMVLSK